MDKNDQCSAKNVFIHDNMDTFGHQFQEKSNRFH